jgi:DNA replication protein DnaC
LKATKLWLRWVSWPERVNTWRVRSAREHGLAEVHNEMVAMCAVDALVLDDIGAERIKGEYADDWVSSLLDQIIDRRYNALKPTWWTTNLSHEDFTRRYGARMSSRLMSMSPLIRVGAQPDQRPQW